MLCLLIALHYIFDANIKTSNHLNNYLSNLLLLAALSFQLYHCTIVLYPRTACYLGSTQY